MCKEGWIGGGGVEKLTREGKELTNSTKIEKGGERPKEGQEINLGKDWEGAHKTQSYPIHLWTVKT